jgi:hypothetical protein
VHTQAPTPKPSSVAVSSPRATANAAPCGSINQRVAAARARLQHQSALPDVTVITQGARPGLLGSSDASARTLTLYVRGCSEEPTLQLAVVWAYEAGQFIRTETWDSSTMSRWRQLRHTSALASAAQFKQDAAAVYALWQTGSTRYWQSPVAPPSLSQLSQLVPYLNFS